MSSTRGDGWIHVLRRLAALGVDMSAAELMRKQGLAANKLITAPLRLSELAGMLAEEVRQVCSPSPIYAKSAKVLP